MYTCVVKDSKKSMVQDDSLSVNHNVQIRIVSYLPIGVLPHYFLPYKNCFDGPLLYENTNWVIRSCDVENKMLST